MMWASALVAAARGGVADLLVVHPAVRMEPFMELSRSKRRPSKPAVLRRNQLRQRESRAPSPSSDLVSVEDVAREMSVRAANPATDVRDRVPTRGIEHPARVQLEKFADLLCGQEEVNGSSPLEGFSERPVKRDTVRVAVGGTANRSPVGDRSGGQVVPPGTGLLRCGKTCAPGKIGAPALLGAGTSWRAATVCDGESIRS
jgi:hypothetical protein